MWTLNTDLATVGYSAAPQPSLYLCVSCTSDELGAGESKSCPQTKAFMWYKCYFNCSYQNLVQKDWIRPSRAQPLLWMSDLF